MGVDKNIRKLFGDVKKSIINVTIDRRFTDVPPQLRVLFIYFYNRFDSICACLNCAIKVFKSACCCLF